MATTPKRNRTKRNQPKPSANAGASGQVRIIAGRWRGRKLSVPDVPGLRPTGDRMRETLFNWLQGDIAGAHCLDLFAGSGALGFEALSRHAQSVTFVEPDPSAYRNLGDTCRLLDVRNSNGLLLHTAKALNPPSDVEATAHLFAGTAQAALDQWADVATAPNFDVVFIDPPFQMNCQWTILQSLAPRLIAPDALVYIEAPTVQGFPEHLPQGCDLAREKRFGDVMARLVRFSGPH